MMKNKKQYPYFVRSMFIFLCMGVLSSCSFRAVKRTKGIVYFKTDSAKHVDQQKLNVFAPRKSSSKKNVLVFIHGGNWNSGNRSLYGFFGSGMARKGIVTVVISYPLSPKATYHEMALASAAAVKWVKEHIADYGGDPERIFVSGHSAGGHLAALVSLDNAYFDSLHITNPIKGTILIDAGALDMYTYMKQQNFEQGHTYLKTFTTDPATWKKASPVYYLHKGKQMPSFLVYQGGETYPFIKETNEIFMGRLLPLAPATPYKIIQGKKHVGMIAQFIKSGSERYKEIIAFMEGVK